MEKLSMQDLGRRSPEEVRESVKNPVIIALDSVRSLQNVGSVFRSADAFLAEKIILGGITGTPPHRDIQKTALGATETVNWEHSAKLAETLMDYKKNGYKIWAIEQTNERQSLETFKHYTGQKHVFVFGNEVNGVSEEVLQVCDGSLEIPQEGSKHSLNISVTVGIVLWQFYLGKKAL